MATVMVDQKVLGEALMRATYLCERCVGQPYSHIVDRGSRRKNSPANFVALCSTCGPRVRGFEREAYMSGWLMDADDDPTTIPVLVDGRMVLLSHEGDYVSVPEYRKAA